MLPSRRKRRMSSSSSRSSSRRLLLLRSPSEPLLQQNLAAAGAACAPVSHGALLLLFARTAKPVPPHSHCSSRQAAAAAAATRACLTTAPGAALLSRSPLAMPAATAPADLVAAASSSSSSCAAASRAALRSSVQRAGEGSSSRRRGDATFVSAGETCFRAAVLYPISSAAVSGGAASFSGEVAFPAVPGGALSSFTAAPAASGGVGGCRVAGTSLNSEAAEEGSRTPSTTCSEYAEEQHVRAVSAGASVAAGVGRVSNIDCSTFLRGESEGSCLNSSSCCKRSGPRHRRWCGCRETCAGAASQGQAVILRADQQQQQQDSSHAVGGITAADAGVGTAALALPRCWRRSTSSAASLQRQQRGLRDVSEQQRGRDGQKHLDRRTTRQLRQSRGQRQQGHCRSASGSRMSPGVAHASSSRSLCVKAREQSVPRVSPKQRREQQQHDRNVSREMETAAEEEDHRHGRRSSSSSKKKKSSCCGGKVSGGNSDRRNSGRNNSSRRHSSTRSKMSSEDGSEKSRSCGRRRPREQQRDAAVCKRRASEEDTWEGEARGEAAGATADARAAGEGGATNSRADSDSGTRDAARNGSRVESSRRSGVSGCSSSNHKKRCGLTTRRGRGRSSCTNGRGQCGTGRNSLSVTSNGSNSREGRRSGQGGRQSTRDSGGRSRSLASKSGGRAKERKNVTAEQQVQVRTQQKQHQKLYVQGRQGKGGRLVKDEERSNHLLQNRRRHVKIFLTSTADAYGAVPAAAGVAAAAAGGHDGYSTVELPQQQRWRDKNARLFAATKCAGSNVSRVRVQTSVSSAGNTRSTPAAVAGGHHPMTGARVAADATRPTCASRSNEAARHSVNMRLLRGQKQHRGQAKKEKVLLPQQQQRGQQRQRSRRLLPSCVSPAGESLVRAASEAGKAAARAAAGRSSGVAAEPRATGASTAEELRSATLASCAAERWHSSGGGLGQRTDKEETARRMQQPAKQRQQQATHQQQQQQGKHGKEQEPGKQQQQPHEQERWQQPECAASDGAADARASFLTLLKHLRQRPQQRAVRRSGAVAAALKRRHLAEKRRQLRAWKGRAANSSVAQLPHQQQQQLEQQEQYQEQEQREMHEATGPPSPCGVTGGAAVAAGHPYKPDTSTPLWISEQQRPVIEDAQSDQDAVGQGSSTVRLTGTAAAPGGAAGEAGTFVSETAAPVGSASLDKAAAAAGGRSAAGAAVDGVAAGAAAEGAAGGSAEGTGTVTQENSCRWSDNGGLQHPHHVRMHARGRLLPSLCSFCPRRLSLFAEQHQQQMQQTQQTERQQPKRGEQEGVQQLEQQQMEQEQQDATQQQSQCRRRTCAQQQEPMQQQQPLGSCVQHEVRGHPRRCCCVHVGEDTQSCPAALTLLQRQQQAPEGGDSAAEEERRGKKRRRGESNVGETQEPQQLLQQREVVQERHGSSVIKEKQSTEGKEKKEGESSTKKRKSLTQSDGLGLGLRRRSSGSKTSCKSVAGQRSSTASDAGPPTATAGGSAYTASAAAVAVSPAAVTARSLATVEPLAAAGHKAEVKLKKEVSMLDGIYWTSAVSRPRRHEASSSTGRRSSGSSGNGSSGNGSSDNGSGGNRGSGSSSRSPADYGGGLGNSWRMSRGRNEGEKRDISAAATCVPGGAGAAGNYIPHICSTGGEGGLQGECGEPAVCSSPLFVGICSAAARAATAATGRLPCGAVAEGCATVTQAAPHRGPGEDAGRGTVAGSAAAMGAGAAARDDPSALAHPVVARAEAATCAAANPLPGAAAYGFRLGTEVPTRCSSADACPKVKQNPRGKLLKRRRISVAGKMRGRWGGGGVRVRSLVVRTMHAAAGSAVSSALQQHRQQQQGCGEVVGSELADEKRVTCEGVPQPQHQHGQLLKEQQAQEGLVQDPQEAVEQQEEQQQESGGFCMAYVRGLARRGGWERVPPSLLLLLLPSELVVKRTSSKKDRSGSRTSVGTRLLLEQQQQQGGNGAAGLVAGRTDEFAAASNGRAAERKNKRKGLLGRRGEIARLLLVQNEWEKASAVSRWKKAREAGRIETLGSFRTRFRGEATLGGAALCTGIRERSTGEF